MYIANVTPKNLENEDYAEVEELTYFKKYYHLHSKFIQPLNIKIDIPLFENEIKKYLHLFRTWDVNRLHLQRYGIALVNEDGDIFKNEDFACSVFDKRNAELPKDKFLHERLFRQKTPIYYRIKSLRPLDVLEDYMLRSNILLWHKGASFLPHIDTIPKRVSNLRLWGVNKPDIYKFESADGDCMCGVEPGRLYLIDTTKFHFAKATGDWLYTFFISLDNSDEVYNIINQLKQ